MDDKRMIIKRWMLKAFRDLQTARTMIRADDPPTDIVCFHSQQCAEKCFKAFLVLMDQDFPKVHDLTRILQMCIIHDKAFIDLEDEATFLADYAVEVRYVSDWRDIPFNEASEALEKAKNVMAFVRGKLGIENNIE
ncbi:MAG TPA: HEPN domain-containing protein [archaeon]|nr:HEPN domain-containing protein [archaeon]